MQTASLHPGGHSCHLWPFPFMHEHTTYSNLMSSALSYLLLPGWHDFFYIWVLCWCALPVFHPSLSLWHMFFRPIIDMYWCSVFRGAFIGMHRQQSCWLITHWGCPSDVELLAKATESIFFMHGDRPAAGCYSDGGAVSAASLLLIRVLPSIWIYLQTLSALQESHQYGTPLVGERQKDKALQI